LQSLAIAIRIPQLTDCSVFWHENGGKKMKDTAIFSCPYFLAEFLSDSNNPCGACLSGLVASPRF
jgi:hypothetical protein